MNFSEVNELNVLKKEKFLFIKFCKLLDFPGFLQKNIPGFFSFQPEIKKGGTFEYMAIAGSLNKPSPTLHRPRFSYSYNNSSVMHSI